MINVAIFSTATSLLLRLLQISPACLRQTPYWPDERRAGDVVRARYELCAVGLRRSAWAVVVRNFFDLCGRLRLFALADDPHVSDVRFRSGVVQAFA